MIKVSSKKSKTLFPADFSFTRACGGYNGKMKFFKPNQLRLDSNIYGGKMALVEEATTNTVGTDNGFKNSINSFTRYGNCTVTLTNEYGGLGGGKCLKAVCVDPGTSGFGIYRSLVNPSQYQGQSLTLSMWVKGEGSSIGKTIRTDIYWNDGTAHDAWGNIVTLTDQWQKIQSTASVSASGVTNVFIYWLSSPGNPLTVGDVVYADRVQTEQKAYSTTWTETFRVAESLTMPVVGTNLIENADCESDIPKLTNAYGNGGLTSTLSTDYFYAGAKSVKISSDALGRTDRYYDLGTGVGLGGMVANQTYTFSAWVYVPSTSGIALSSVKLKLFYWITSWLAFTGSSPTAFDTWQRISVTGTLPITSINAFLRIWLNQDIAGASFYVDNLQLEQGPAPSTWVLATQSKMPLGLPITQGTIEGIVEVNDNTKVSSGGINRRVFQINKNSGTNAVILIYYLTTSSFELQVFDDSGSMTGQASIPGSSVPNGIYYYKAILASAYIKIEFWSLATRTKVGESTDNTISYPSSYGTVMAVGNHLVGAYNSNTRYGKHKISNVAITADPDFTNLMPRDGNTVALMDFDDIQIRGQQGGSL